MQQLSPLNLARLSVAEGATTPVPTGGAGAVAWSTTLGAQVQWTGSRWTAQPMLGLQVALAANNMGIF